MPIYVFREWVDGQKAKCWVTEWSEMEFYDYFSTSGAKKAHFSAFYAYLIFTLSYPCIPIC